MRTVWDHPKAVSQFVSKLIPGGMGFDSCQAMGVIDEAGRLIAGMVYHNWSPEAGVIEISGAGVDSRWLTRNILRQMFAYPFEGLKCQAVVMRVSERNTHVHRMLKAYGFTHYRIPRLRGRDEDEIVFVLTDDDWRANRFNTRPQNG